MQKVEVGLFLSEGVSGEEFCTAVVTVCCRTVLFNKLSNLLVMRLTVMCVFSSCIAASSICIHLSVLGRVQLNYDD